jgi:hypothetical protein
VQEITVDGDVVFSAGPGIGDIVASSNLVAWFPMEAGTVLDETRTGGILDNEGISVGDSTDYSGSVQNATHLSSGGAFDLDTGGNSGVFDFDGTGDLLTTGVFETEPVTMMAWARFDGASLGNRNYIFDQDENRFNISTGRDGRVGMEAEIFDGSSKQISTSNTASTLTHFAVTVASDGTMKFYINGASQGSISTSGIAVLNTSRHLTIGHSFADIGTNNSDGWNGLIDDVRVYNTDLSQSQIDQIYENTEP